MYKKDSPKKHQVQPDRKFSSLIIAQLINKVMRDGEKRKAMKIVYKAIQIAEKEIALEPLIILEKVLENIKPNMELKSWKKGGASYRIPTKVGEQRSLSLALRWMVESARKKKSTKPIFQRLSEEIIEAYNKTGGAFQKKETVQKEVMSNMAFAR